MHAQLSQWVDLGDLTPFSCFPMPSLCGATSATLSLWMTQVMSCDGGIIGSQGLNTEGFTIDGMQFVSEDYR